MKNFVKHFGIIAIVAVIIFGFTACDNGNGDNGGGGGGSGDTSGTFTVNASYDTVMNFGYICNLANYSDFDVIVSLNGITKTFPRRSTNQPISETFTNLPSSNTSGTYTPANKVRYESQSGQVRFYNK